MKKQSLLLITGGILAFASCTNENAGTTDNSQAKIDSIVNERVEMIRAELEMKNDSIINAMAMYKADSMMAAMAGKPIPKKPAAKPAGKDEPAAPAEEPKRKIQEGSDQNKQSARDRMQSGSDQGKQSARDRIKSSSDQNK